MGFFKELKEDTAQAMKELLPEQDFVEETAEDEFVVNTLEDELDVETELSKLNGLLEDVPEEPIVQEVKEEVKEEPVAETAEVKEENKMTKDTILENDIMATPVAEPVAPQTEPVAQAAPAAEAFAPQASEFVVSDEVTVITEGTSIAGNLQSQGSIDIRGTVTGDVQCNGKLTVTGVVRGNTSSSEFFADNAKLEGEVTTSGTVKIGIGSVVVGNISATSAVIAGAIKGDIDVKGPVVVDTSAVVMGNIKSRSVQINNGAVIEGFCSQCYSEIDMDSLFG